MDGLSLLRPSFHRTSAGGPGLPLYPTGRWVCKPLSEFAPNPVFALSEPGEVRQWTDILCDDRPSIERALAARNIGTRNFWLPLHRQEPYRQEDALFPIA